jgi:CheY-like chemotaxis protein
VTGPTARELRVLILDDVEADAELMADALRRAGVPARSRYARTRAQFVAALAEEPPDVVLADYALPETMTTGTSGACS